MATPEVKMIGASGPGAARRQTREESVRESLHQAWYLGIGALALTWDEINGFANRLVDRGEVVEQESRKLIQSVVKQSQDTAANAEEELNRRARELLVRLNIPTMHDIQGMDFPTRADLNELNQRLAALNRSINQIKKLEQPQIEQAEEIAGKVGALAREIKDLKAIEEPQAQQAEALAGKVGTLTRKINEIQKAQEEEAAPAPARKAPAKK